MIDQKEYIQSRMIDEIKSLADHGFNRIAVGMMAQYIETLGAFLDKKPFKVPRQSAERFDLALKELFPSRYHSLNKKGFLYKQLRSNFTHLGVESQFLNFEYADENIENHLKYRDKRTTIVLSCFLSDYTKACNSIIENLKSNKLKGKALA